MQITSVVIILLLRCFVRKISFLREPLRVEGVGVEVALGTLPWLVQRFFMTSHPARLWVL